MGPLEAETGGIEQLFTLQGLTLHLFCWFGKSHRRTSFSPVTMRGSRKRPGGTGFLSCRN